MKADDERDPVEVTRHVRCAPFETEANMVQAGALMSAEMILSDHVRSASTIDFHF
jgi:hypothetical protein